MRRHDDRLTALDAVASAQDGLATAAQLAELRIAASTVSRRTRPGGMWTRVLPGVHLVTGGSPDRRQRERASLLYAGPGAVLTGLTALRHHGVRANRLQESDDDRRRPDTVFVLVPHARRRTSTGFVRLERTHRMPTPDDAGNRLGLALAPVPRAVADAARRMGDPWDVRALVAEVVRSGLADVASMDSELRLGSRRGAAHLRDALEHVRAGVWSGAEADLRDAVLSTGLPEPMWNARVVAASGALVAIPDAWFDDVALAVELDSREYHADGRDWERTLRRQRSYAAHGVPVVPVTPGQLRGERESVMRAIRSAYQAAGGRRRPDVVAVSSAGTGDVRLPPFRWGA